MKKKTLIILISIVTGLSLILGAVGLTYSWISSNIVGVGNDIHVIGKNLILNYTDSLAVNETSLVPGYSVTKTLTVQNTSTETLYYKMYFKNLINTTVTDQLTYEITGANSVTEKPIPKSQSSIDTHIFRGIQIPANTTQTYTLVIRYKDSDTIDQTSDSGKTFSTTIELASIRKEDMPV
ncbi:MAG: hypothetical protein RSC57_03350 [Bacilli bacterium]